MPDIKEKIIPMKKSYIGSHSLKKIATISGITIRMPSIMLIFPRLNRIILVSFKVGRVII
jgi:hypothetical protein